MKDDQEPVVEPGAAMPAHGDASRLARRDKPPMRPFSSTPLVGQIAARNAPWVIACSCLMVYRHEVFPLWLGVALLILSMGVFVWLIAGFPGHRRFVAVLKQLHGELRWFDAEAITWFAPEQADELRAALGKQGVELHELDGKQIPSLAALSGELQQRFGNRSWPKAPEANAALSLAQAATKQRRILAVLWHDVATLAQQDMVGFARFVAHWSNTMAQSTPHVLLFLARPAPSRATALPHEPRSSAEAAAADAWWQTRPGELAK